MLTVLFSTFYKMSGVQIRSILSFQPSIFPFNHPESLLIFIIRFCRQSHEELLAKLIQHLLRKPTVMCCSWCCSWLANKCGFFFPSLQKMTAEPLSVCFLFQGLSGKATCFNQSKQHKCVVKIFKIVFAWKVNNACIFIAYYPWPPQSPVCFSSAFSRMETLGTTHRHSIHIHWAVELSTFHIWCKIYLILVKVLQLRLIFLWCL